MRPPEIEHLPVMVEEVVEFLAPERGGVVVDCTVGLGGHAAAVLMAGPGVELVGIDRDPRALESAAARLEAFGSRVRLVEGRFSRVSELLADLGIAAAAGILADLGLSSLQLGTPERGFSFRHEGPLDMRMGRGDLTAAEIVNRYPEKRLEQVFREYGEERQARRIARAVVAARERRPLATTTELRELVLEAKGLAEPRREGRVDPATRVFQALRIAVNDELEELRSWVDQAARLLERGGRLVAIAYHSLEDRIVKDGLRQLARGEVDRITGQSRPESRLLELLTRGPLRPKPAEIAVNPRARSARLRAARRI